MDKVSEEIRKRIIEDNIFSSELAMELKVQQQSVISLAKRNSEKLTLYRVVQFFKSKGFKESEIFQNPPSENKKQTNNE